MAVSVSSMTREPALDRSLGWFSVGLGMAELLAPKAMGRMIGVGDHATVLRMCGVREIVSGVGLLSGRAPATFAMSRVAGDVMDLALLGAALRSPDSNPSRVAAAATAVAGVAALDLYASKVELQTSMAEAQQDVPVHATLVINSTPDEVYAFWRKLENLPRFMSHVESVSELTQQRSEWSARLPGGMQLRWQSEIVEDQPGRLISWRTVAGSEINHVGSVRFEAAPNGQGTQVHVEIYYGMPGGPAAAKAAGLLSMAPESMVTEELRRLKQLIETGEIATTQGQPTGKRSMIGRMFGKEES